MSDQELNEELEGSDEVDTRQEEQRTVPLSAIAEERAKKREAQARAEEAQLENERLRQELETMKHKSAAPTADESMDDLDIYDPDAVRKYIKAQVDQGVGQFKTELERQREEEELRYQEAEYLQSQIDKYPIFNDEDVDNRDIARGTLQLALQGANSADDYADIVREVAERVSKKLVVANNASVSAEQGHIDPLPTSSQANDGSRIVENATQAGKKSWEEAKKAAYDRVARKQVANRIDSQR